MKIFSLREKAILHFPSLYENLLWSFSHREKAILHFPSLYENLLLVFSNQEKAILQFPSLPSHYVLKNPGTFLGYKLCLLESAWLHEYWVAWVLNSYVFIEKERIYILGLQRIILSRGCVKKQFFKFWFAMPKLNNWLK